MGFKGLMLGLVAFAAGTIAVSYFATEPPEEQTEAPREAAQAAPSLGNLASAFGIALSSAGGTINTTAGKPANRLESDPAKTRKAEFYGWKVYHPGLIGPNDSVHLVQSAVTDFPLKQPLEYPAEVVAQAPAEGCRAPQRAPGEKLVKVQIQSGRTESGYHAVSKKDLARGAMSYVARLQRASDPENERASGETKAAHAVNVVVTDESAPLYLILQVGAGPVVFNIHGTPGVEIAEIVVVGRPGNAVHPLSPETPITFLPISADCAPQPWRAAQPWWDVYHRLGGNNEREERRSIETHARYEEWFLAAFGEASDPGTIGAWETNHILVGPMPQTAEARAPYRTLNSARIVAHEGPLLYVSQPRQREADVSARRHALALAAAGGDISIINPAPMERAE